MPFANVADPIPIVAKEAGEGFFPRSFERLEALVPMAGHPLTGEKRRAADTTDRGGYAVLRETYTLRSKRIEVGRFDNGVSGAAERIETPVIRIENHDISFFGSGVETCGEGKIQEDSHG